MSSNNRTHDFRRLHLPEEDWRADWHPPVSPISVNDSLSSLRQAHYGHHVGAGQVRSVSPVRRSGAADMSTSRPGHGGRPYSPPDYHQPRHKPSAPYMPTASDLSPADPEGRALRDIDNLFGPRDVMSPSPEPEDPRSYAAPQYPSTPPRQKRRRKAHDRTRTASTTAPLMTDMRSSPLQESPSPSRRHRGGPPSAAAGAQRSYVELPEPASHAQREYAATPPRQESRQNMHRHTDPASSNAPLMGSRGSPLSREAPSPARRGYGVPAAAGVGAGAGAGAAAEYYGSEVPRRWQGEEYSDFDPNSIADDGDDGLDDPPRQKRNYRKSMAPGAAGAGLGGAAVADEASKGGFKVFDVRHGAVERGSDDMSSRDGSDPEKSEWLEKQNHGSKRMKWIIGSIILLVALAAVVGGTTGGILGMKSKESNGSSSTSSSTSSSDKGNSGDLYDIDSPEIKELLNNQAFHKVFPGMDYTPLNAQYPDCIANPPDQNNITKDIAQLAQLTPAVRLYGTDCNQTEKVLTAISRLGYNDTLQVWLGVWLGKNATTNSRQLAQMEDLLHAYDAKHFAGIIVGNEVLFREDMSEASLAGNLTSVRQTLADLSLDLPVATSDLGDDWTAELAADSDMVLANVHPFFAGVTPAAAPGWTWDFWQNHNVDLKTAPSAEGKGWPGSIIAEVGWPSEGGTNCGGADGSCGSGEEGATAGVDEMNEFMEGWVCQSLRNGTTYFWFEAFDEPWKKQFDTDTQKWESKWGLMDADRKLKDGLKIPDCDGLTVEKAFCC